MKYKVGDFLKVLQAKAESNETKFKKALVKIQQPPDLSPDEKTFSKMLSKVTPQGAKIEWVELDESLAFPKSVAAQQAELHKKKQLEQTMLYGTAQLNAADTSWKAVDPNKWWSYTNDPNTWGKQTPANHVPALSASASWSSTNYTQVFPKNVEDAFKEWKPPHYMTREKAIALNNGDPS